MANYNKQILVGRGAIAFVLIMAFRHITVKHYINDIERKASEQQHSLLQLNSIENLTSSNIYDAFNGSNAIHEIATRATNSQNKTSIGRSNQTDSSLATFNNETIDKNAKGPQVYQWSIPDKTNHNSKAPLFLQYCNSWHRNTKARVPWATFPRPLSPETATLNENGQPRNEVQMVFNSSGIFRQSDAGTGNWVTSLYILRYILSSNLMPDPKPQGRTANKNDFQLISIDAQDSQDSTVLPWLSGYFDSDVTRKILDDYWAPHEVPKIDCSILKGRFGEIPLMWFFPIFQYELQRMALHLVGAPANDPGHPAHEFEKQVISPYQLPLASSSYPRFPDIELDDVAIHFRCGDIIDSDYAWFRFLKFSAYARRIDGNATKSIGIVTQPFKDQIRMNDRVLDGDFFRHRVCEDIVRGMQHYLQDAFPDAQVSIRNDPSETVAMAFTRLIMAKQAFASPDSSFSVLPVLSSFGTGFHLRPDRANFWISTNEEVFGAKSMATQVIMDESVVMNAKTTKLLRRKDEEKAPYHILQWFLNDTYVLPRLTKRNH